MIGGVNLPERPATVRRIGAMEHGTTDTHAAHRFEVLVDDVLSTTLLVMLRRLDDIPREALPCCD